MKILIIFIDMVRVDHLHSYNEHAQECLLDKRLKDIGGTLFTRCYSPGPDTPRSMACMQTGLYPHFNGCDTRIRWPKYFVKDEIDTIWDHAANKGFRVNLCCNKNETITGFFRFKESDSISMYFSPEKFVKNGMFCDNSLSFIGIPDMHTAIGDYKATDYAFKKGDQIVDMYFKNYLTKDFVSQFDYTIIFSDHGFQSEKESRNMKSTLELLEDGRNQLLMFVHKQTDKTIVKDNRLASMTDLYATLEQMIGAEDYRQGFSLLEKPKRYITHVEDHQDFNVYPEIMIKQWRVISDDFDIRTDVKNTIVSRGTEEDKKQMDEYLREYAPKYADYVKQLQVWGYYDTLKSEESNLYFNGVPRAKNSALLPIKVFFKMRRLFHI